MIVRENFEVVFRDRSECEHLLAQVRFKNIEICEINRERGVDQMEIEMFCNDPLYNDLNIKFSLDDFVEALRVAKAELRML